MHVLMIAAVLAAQGGQVVGLALQPPVGLTEEETAAITQKITDEVGAASMMVVHADAVDPACAPDAGCVEQARVALPEAPSALLVVELIRVGPVVQLTATGAAGEAQVNGSHSLDEQQLKAGPVLPKEIRGWIDALAQQHVTPPPLEEDPVVDTPPQEQGMSVMRRGAFAALGGGALALLAGGMIAATQESVLGDAASTGDQKEGARTAGLVGLVVAAVGVVAVGGGAALFLLE